MYSSTFEEAFGLPPMTRTRKPKELPGEQGRFTAWFHGPGQIVLTLVGATFLLISTIVGAVLWGNAKMNHFESSVATANKTATDVQKEQLKYAELLTVVMKGEERRNQMAAEDRKATIEVFRYLVLHLDGPDRRQQIERIMRELENKKISEYGPLYDAGGGGLAPPLKQEN